MESESFKIVSCYARQLEANDSVWNVVDEKTKLLLRSPLKVAESIRSVHDLYCRGNIDKYELLYTWLNKVETKHNVEFECMSRQGTRSGAWYSFESWIPFKKRRMFYESSRTDFWEQIAQPLRQLQTRWWSAVESISHLVGATSRERNMQNERRVIRTKNRLGLG
jgi:hypothetical protein